MTLRAGNRRNRIDAADRAGRRALTLIELILVMGLLSIVFALASPTLARFFRGRTLDSETKRFLALTRFAQSRAASEGVPMMLWIDAEKRAYGLQAATGFVDVDTNAVQFQLADRLKFEVTEAAAETSWFDQNRVSSTPVPGTVTAMGTVTLAEGTMNLPTLRFLPDGSIGESSPQAVGIRENEEEPIWIGQSRNRLNYEIQSNQPRATRR